MSSYTLSGSGTQALSSNVTAAHVAINTPAVSAAGRGNPAAFYDVALLRFGDGTAYWDAMPVTGGPQWIPVPFGATIVGYRVFGATSITLTEVIGGVPPFGGTGYSPTVFETILGGTASSVTLPGSGTIPGGLRNLRLTWTGSCDNAAVQGLFLRFNGDTANNYRWAGLSISSGGGSGFGTNPDSGVRIGAIGPNSGAPAASGGVAFVQNYAGTTFHKQVQAVDSYGFSPPLAQPTAGAWLSAAAITSVNVHPGAGNLVAGSVFTLYVD